MLEFDNVSSNWKVEGIFDSNCVALSLRRGNIPTWSVGCCS